MKLIHARIKNFRLLKKLFLDFSTDFDKPLTVIRAANESGKTTSEMALIWGLYGSLSALPYKGAKYPLYPSDALANNERRVEISVEIDFETEQVVPVGRGRQEVKQVHFRLLRSCVEYPSASENVKREYEKVSLHEVKQEGITRIHDSQIKGIIEKAIPEALKDVYFTDGDSAMSFIEAAAAKGVKRKRVQAAIEALLGLHVLERSTKHIDNVTRKFQSTIDNTDYAEKSERINDQISGFSEDVDDWGGTLEDKETEIPEGVTKLRAVENKIEDILKLGDKSKLVIEIQNLKSNIASNNNDAGKSLKELSSLLKNPDVSASMIMEPASKGLEILRGLSESKVFPKVNIPILEELLDRTNCFCGVDLSEETKEGKKRRQSIEAAIEESVSSDALQESASSLFFSIRSELFDASAAQKWKEKYNDSCETYQQRIASSCVFDAQLKEKESEKDLINDEQLQALRQQEQTLKNKLNARRLEVGELSGKISGAKERLVDLKREQINVENKLNKNDTSTYKIRLSRLTKTVFDNVFDFLRKDEVKRVSDEMNRIFLDMIGADPDNNDLATITKAELTEEFDILVFGSNGHKLNPDQDLNGASRRAITLAFILALTKVSEVKAPNVIDTPLGMMSGYVKQSVLNKTLEEGSQIILFLTHDEIQGVESILDNKAGKIFTLTNPAHSKMLVNKPTAIDIGVVRCDCNHRESCDTCARTNIDMEGN